MRGILLGALLLGGPASAIEELSGEQVQMIMQQLDPMFSTLSVCINGECTAAYECGHPPSLFKRPDGAVQVFVDCDVSISFICNNGVELLRPNDWCQINYPNGRYMKVTMTYDGFIIEGL